MCENCGQSYRGQSHRVYCCQCEEQFPAMEWIEEYLLAHGEKLATPLGRKMTGNA
jgi:hypothetical protein